MSGSAVPILRCDHRPKCRASPAGAPSWSVATRAASTPADRSLVTGEGSRAPPSRSPRDRAARSRSRVDLALRSRVVVRSGRPRGCCPPHRRFGCMPVVLASEGTVASSARVSATYRVQCSGYSTRRRGPSGTCAGRGTSQGRPLSDDPSARDGGGCPQRPTRRAATLTATRSDSEGIDTIRTTHTPRETGQPWETSAHGISQPG